MSITKSEIRDAADAAVRLLQEHLGDQFLVTYFKGGYGDVGRITLEIVKEDGSGRMVTGLEQAFLLNAETVGLEQGDFGAQFKSNGSWYEIVGFKARNRKYPIIAKRLSTGDNYKFHEDRVLMAKRMGGDHWRSAE